MTAVYYPDCKATSDDRKFTLEAISPHNGTIDHRDGTRPTDDEFPSKYRDHQREFRYRLLDHRDNEPDSCSLGQERDCVLWERWQGRGEDSPHELLVSDEAWSILRTHGFRPEVIAVSPHGDDVLRVRITGDGAEHPQTAESKSEFTWRPDQLEFTTAGLYWSADSWRYFLSHDDRPHFCWRTCWGQRLVLDLGRARILSEDEQSHPRLTNALYEEERVCASALLKVMSPSIEEVRKRLGGGTKSLEDHPLESKIMSVRSAIHLVGVHRIADCVPLLRGWEGIDCPGFSTGSMAMRRSWLEVQYFRPILHHSLRLLDEEPLGFPTYHFRDNDNNRFPLPEQIADRRSRSGQVDREMPAEDILRLLGSPDHITTRRSQQGEKVSRRTERWEYDSRLKSGWITSRITWEEEKRKGRIAAIDELPSEWLQSDERAWEILGLHH